MKKFLAVLLVAIACILPFSGCKGDSSTTIRLNEVTHSIFYAPLYVAIEQGFFKDENIKIELTNGGGADKTMASVLSGSADIGFCGPEAVLYVVAGESTNPSKVFGQLTKRDGSFLVSRKSEPDFKWSDLANKTVIAGRAGGVPAMTFEYVCNQNNLKNGENITLDTQTAFNAMATAFEGGAGDYCTMFEPTASDFEEQGKGYIVASVGKAGGEVPYTCFFAKDSYIKDNAKTIESFLRAMTKAIKYVKNTDLDTVARSIVGQFETFSLKSIKKSLESYISIDAWVDNMAMTEESLNNLQNIIANSGNLPKRVSLTDMVINDYAKKIYEELNP